MTSTTTRRRFGKLRRLPSGRYQASYVGPDLARHTAPRTFEDRGAAEWWLAEERRRLDFGEDWSPPKARAKARSVAGATLDAWVQGGAIERRRVRGTALKPRTLALYQSQYRRLISPVLGSKPMRAITKDAIAAWYDGLDPAKPTQRAHAYSLLRALMAQAVDEGVIATNPVSIRGAGRVARPEHHVPPPTPDEIAAMAEAMPPRLSALVLLAGWCGLRAGELMELRRKDVDLARGVVRVERAVVRVNAEDVVQTPKSLAGIRAVAAPPHIRGAIERHLVEFVEPEPDALLFPAASGRHLAHTELTKSFKRAREAAGRQDLHLHDLRHAAATMAATAGATLAELQARLGHSTAAAALRYQHAAQARDAEIAERMSRLATRSGKAKKNAKKSAKG